MSNLHKSFIIFLKDENGSEAIEYLLLVGGIIIPLAALMFKVSEMVAKYYSYCSWLISLPFP